MASDMSFIPYVLSHEVIVAEDKVEKAAPQQITSNYSEYIVSDDKSTANDISYNIDDTIFENKQNQAAKLQSRTGFKTTFYRYIHNDMIYEIAEQTDEKIKKGGQAGQQSEKVRTYRKQPVDVNVDKNTNNIIICKFKKEKIPFHLFPSTNKISKYKIELTSYRIHHQIFANFERQINQANNKIINKIFVNVIDDQKSDPEYIKKMLANSLKIILA